MWLTDFQGLRALLGALLYIEKVSDPLVSCRYANGILVKTCKKAAKAICRDGFKKYFLSFLEKFNDKMRVRDLSCRFLQVPCV